MLTPCKLTFVELLIKAALRQQFIMRTALDNVAGLHHQNLVSIFDGGQAMGHNKACAPFINSSKASWHQHLGAGVNAGGGLIQNQNRRTPQHDPRNTEQLPLSLADIAAVLGNLRIIPIRQTADKAMGARLLGCGYDLLTGGVRFAVGDVFCNCTGFEPCFLQHHAKIARRLSRVTVSMGCPSTRSVPLLIS